MTTHGHLNHLNHEPFASYTPSRASTPVPGPTPTLSPLANKVIAITGAASGIGLALALHLLSCHAQISIADSNQSALHHALLVLEKAYPGTSPRILPTILDVRNSAAIDAWLTHTIEKFGRLDGAANLAGIFVTPATPQRPTRDVEDSAWDLILGVNLTGVKNCLRSELKLMGAGGSIVNAASIAGLRGTAGLGAYCVSKAGVIALTKCAAREEGPRGIRINAIAPGLIDTPMLSAFDVDIGEEQTKKYVEAIPMARKGSAEEIAKVVAFLLSDHSSYINGSVQVIDGGFTS